MCNKCRGATGWSTGGSTCMRKMLLFLFYPFERFEPSFLNRGRGRPVGRPAGRPVSLFFFFLSFFVSLHFCSQLFFLFLFSFIFPSITYMSAIWIMLSYKPIIHMPDKYDHTLNKTEHYEYLEIHDIYFIFILLFFLFL